MQRTSVVAEIFGYLVCLLAVVVFFVSIAGIVNNAFRVVHPTARPGAMLRMGVRPAGIMGPSGIDMSARRARFIADTRYNAMRRLVLAIVMLVVAIVVFRRSFDWLNPKQIAAS